MSLAVSATAPPSTLLWHFQVRPPRSTTVCDVAILHCGIKRECNFLHWCLKFSGGTRNTPPPRPPPAHTHTPSTHFSCSRRRAGLSVCTMRTLWGLNALLAPGNHGCIQIKMTDKDIKAQWHFTDLWYCSRLLCIRGFKLKPVGDFALSESLQVDAECPVTYCAIFFFYFFSVCYAIFSYTAIKRVIRPTSIIDSLCHTSTYGFKVNTRNTVGLIIII